MGLFCKDFVLSLNNVFLFFKKTRFNTSFMLDVCCKKNAILSFSYKKVPIIVIIYAASAADDDNNW